VQQICSAFCLSQEQETALRSVARYAFNKATLPLSVSSNVGGYGNTRTIKAITAFFTGSKEAYTFTLVGPSGSTAAMFSSYHSVLSVPPR
ncbi:hypothetical protein C8R43DRAFT_826281, partial [Mycena crocata]